MIIPCKDGAATLPTTFQSLLTQFREPERLQVIFVDDGSTDDTHRVVDEFAERLPHFEHVRNPVPTGLANARNAGLALATADHIAFLDGDDWLVPGHLETVLTTATELDVDFVRTDHVAVEGTKRSLRRAPMAIRGQRLDPRDGILPNNESTMVDYPYAWAGVFHRRLVDAGLLAFPADFMTAEDRSWIWKLHLKAQSYAVADVAGVCYRRGTAGTLTQIVDARQLDFIRAFGLIVDQVQADQEADRWWPKVIRNWFAILEHQLRRFHRAPAPLRRQLRSGAVAVTRRMPEEQLHSEFRHQARKRRLRIHRHLGDDLHFLREAWA